MKKLERKREKERGREGERKGRRKGGREEKRKNIVSELSIHGREGKVGDHDFPLKPAPYYLICQHAHALL